MSAVLLATAPADAAHPVAADTIHALFERAAALRGDAPALRHAGSVVSYAELNARANRVAHHLRARGVGPEAAVAVFMPRTPELIAALLGVLKAGGAYVPVDPAYPPARTAAILQDARAGLVLTHSSVADRLPPGAPALRLDAVAPELAGVPDHDPEPAARPENLAYVIHTSGSTGRPKGVAIEHRNALAVLGWWRRTVGDAELEAVLGSTSVCFDVSIAEIFGTLCWGGTLVLVDDALALAGLAEPVRLVCMVPSAAAELVRMGGIPPCVRVLALGGEPVPPALAREAFRRTGVQRVLNLYGPTEDTTYSTCAELDAEQAAPVPVGVPVGGGAVHVLDPGLRPVAPGAEGELYMAGAGVTRGYLGRPGLTAERYLPDPLSPVPGARMYRSGDVGRRRPDGVLECFGRTDHQVKIRGFRVEPGDVEAALLDHPGVAAVAVTARGEAGSRYLAAHVVAPDGPGLDELRAWLRERIPEYMLPTAWMRLDALPRTPNGKVDRLALPEPVAGCAAPAAQLAPRTVVEEVVAGIWAEVLGITRPGVRDDFYELGGHSLRAVQIAARIRAAFEVDLPLPVVFENPTVEGQAREVERRLGTRWAAEQPIPRADRSRPLPLSAAQEAVWFFERLSPGMRSYQFQASVRFRGRLDAPALRRALGEIVRRHEIFRTTFVEEDGRPVQRIQAAWAPGLPLHDLAGSADPQAALGRAFEAEFARPFDPGALPLVRWTLFRLSPEEHVLLCVEHHLVHDGWSFGVFLKELVTLYDAFARGLPSPLEAPGVQFADYAAWQRAWLATPEAGQHLDFWRERLAGAPPALELPTDLPRPPRVSFRGRSLHLRLPPRLAHAADAFSRRHGVTLYMTLLAAFQALLGRYTGQAEFVIGGGTAARGRRELEETIGMLVNVIPLRADLHGEPGFAALVERVRSAALLEYAHQDVPFAAIVDALQPERTLDRNPVFQVAFNAHHAPYPALRLPEVELEVTEALGNHTAKFDLQVIAIPRSQQNAAAADETVLIWEYSTDLFHEETVRRMARHYERLLEGMLEDPERPVARVPLLDPDEQRTLLAWGAAPADYPRNATVHGAFAGVAARRAAAVAVEGHGRALTYAELERASGAVAARLRGLGIGPEAAVGVWAERGPELVVAMLGALRAGAAYVPLAPEYPAARLHRMMRDARIQALLVPSGGSAPEGFAGPVVPVDLDAPAAGEVEVQVSPDSVACILFTSGTTGSPKGIEVTHRGIVRIALGGYARLGPDDRVPQLANPSFDAILWEVWATLLGGARLVGIEPADLLDPARLAGRIREQGITAAFLTTALFNQVARESPAVLGGMRFAIFGGEAADADAVRLALGAGAAGRVINAYGPTEGTTYSSVHVVADLPAGAVGVPIGRPLPGTRLFVLDPQGAPQPVGVAGELCVGGDGLARGYRGRGGLTAERFVPDPFGEVGARLYRTGDRARWTGDGVLEFVGRADAQVKIRGFRVEPAEVEAVLRGHPGVAAAAVVAREGPAGRTLVGYLVPRPGASITADAARAYLAAQLPAYMVPAALVPLDSLPLTPNGKLDRAALPEPAAAHPVPQPLRADEALVAAAWREVLGAGQIDPADDFFSLGGHSLLAARAAARVGAAFGVDLPVAAIFQAPTVRALAALAAGRREALLQERLDWLDGLTDEEAEALLDSPISGREPR